MINFNNKLIEKIFDKYVLITNKEAISKDRLYTDKLKLTLMLGGNEMPLFNGRLEKIGVIKFVKAYSEYTAEEKDRLLKLSLRRAESNYILNNSLYEYPTIVCQQIVTGKRLRHKENILNKTKKLSLVLETKFAFFDKDDVNQYPLYTFRGPEVEYEYYTGEKILSNGTIISEFNLNPLDFQELYYRIDQCFASKYTDEMNMPHLWPDKSNIKDIIEYWKNIPIEERKDWEPDSEYSMFGGDESRKLAYGDKIVTGPINSSTNYDIEERKQEHDKIYKPYTVKADNTVKCTSRWIPSQNLKVGK